MENVLGGRHMRGGRHVRGRARGHCRESRPGGRRRRGGNWRTRRGVGRGRWGLGPDRLGVDRKGQDESRSVGEPSTCLCMKGSPMNAGRRGRLDRDRPGALVRDDGASGPTFPRRRRLRAAKETLCLGQDFSRRGALGRSRPLERQRGGGQWRLSKDRRRDRARRRDEQEQPPHARSGLPLRGDLRVLLARHRSCAPLILPPALGALTPFRRGGCVNLLPRQVPLPVPESPRGPFFCPRRACWRRCAEGSAREAELRVETITDGIATDLRRPHSEGAGDPPARPSTVEPARDVWRSRPHSPVTGSSPDPTWRQMLVWAPISRRFQGKLIANSAGLSNVRSRTHRISVLERVPT